MVRGGSFVGWGRIWGNYCLGSGSGGKGLKISSDCGLIGCLIILYCWIKCGGNWCILVVVVSGKC